MALRILHADPAIIAVDKPAGFHIHAPEDRAHRISDAVNCLKVLREQTGLHLHPVHRLDRATSGVLVMACSPAAAAAVQRQFQSGAVRKTYVALVRGWPAPEGNLDGPLKDDATGLFQHALTRFRVLHFAELDVPSPPHATTRCALVRAEPVTGRRHQLRRHFQHAGHPLLGDVEHGDKLHNRRFRELVRHGQLMLKAYALELVSPATGQPLRLRARWDHPWHRAFDVLGACPCLPPPACTAELQPIPAWLPAGAQPIATPRTSRTAAAGAAGRCSPGRHAM